MARDTAGAGRAGGIGRVIAVAASRATGSGGGTTVAGRCVAVLGLLVALLIGVGGGVAGAHAGLVGTVPVDGEVLDSRPDQVLVRFTEPVQVRPEGLAVYDDRLEPVQRGAAGHPTDDAAEVGVALAPDLSDGTYTVTWRVTSADGHPVTGSSRFSVGEPSDAAPPPVQSDSGAVTSVLAAARGAGYLGMVLALGAPLVLWILWRGGRGDRWIRTPALAGAGLVAVGALAELLFQGPARAGLRAADAFDPGLLTETVQTVAGASQVIRLIAAAVIAWWAARTTGRGPAAPMPILTGIALTAVVAATMAVTGHSGAGVLVGWSIPADIAHTAAMTVWFGGLVVFTVAAVRAGAETPAPTALADLGRFSRWATVCVAVLIGTGLFQTWRTVRFPAALIDTAYGRLLLVKVAIVAVVVILGAGARRWVRRTDDAQPPERAVVRRLRRGLVGELLFGAAVIAVTAVLTGTASAREAYRPVITQTVESGPQTLRAELDPARTGTAVLTVRLRDDTGAAIPMHQVDGSMQPADSGLGPFPVELDVDSDGAVARASVQLPKAGRWDFDLSVQTSPTAATTYRVSVQVH